MEPSSESRERARATAALLRRRAAASPLWLPVHGMSMGPSIVDGSEVRLVPGSRPRRGELWAFYSVDGDLVVHRCRRFEDGAYVFAGDAQVIADAPVHDDLLVGKVAAFRNAGVTRTLTARDRLMWRAKNARRALRARLKPPVRRGGWS